MTPSGNFVTTARVKDWVEMLKSLRDVLRLHVDVRRKRAGLKFCPPIINPGKATTQMMDEKTEGQRQQAKSAVLSEFICLQLLVLAA